MIVFFINLCVYFFFLQEKVIKFTSTSQIFANQLIFTDIYYILAQLRLVHSHNNDVLNED